MRILRGAISSMRGDVRRASYSRALHDTIGELRSRLKQMQATTQR